jgi:hypothetical protein
VAIYSYVSPFHEAEFCGMPSRAFDKLGCAMGEKSLQDTGIFSSPLYSTLLCGLASLLQYYVLDIFLVGKVATLVVLCH